MKRNSIRHLNLVLIAVLMVAALATTSPASPARAAGRCYVDASASGTNSGYSWTNAYTDLQSALADSCTEIWVAAGSYIPHASDRSVPFALQNGVAIYGGFVGTETLLSERDPLANVTTLSGDLNGDDSGFTNNGENSYHVVVGSGTDSTAVLDGFTIRGGNSAGSSGGGMYNNTGSPTLTNVTFSGNSADYGGGMYNYNSSPTLTNVTFSGNSANRGGGMFNYSYHISSSPTLTNVTFSGNSADYGGGLYNAYDSSPTLTNVTFSDNSAGNRGGGMYNEHSSPTLTNVTFSANSATDGGGMYNFYNSSPTLANVTFSANSANYGGGMYNEEMSSPTLTNVIIANSAGGGDCSNNFSALNAASKNNLIEDSAKACDLTDGVDGNIIGSDPMLDALANNGGSTETFALQASSPAIDAGTNTGCPADDQRGVLRPRNVTCDIGAYEFENYVVTFNANGGTGTMSPQTAVAPTALTLNAFTRAGYFFSGWNTLADGSGTAYADGATYPFAADATLYAQWIFPQLATFYSIGGYDGTIFETNENSGVGSVPNVPGATLDVGDHLLDRQSLLLVHFDTSSLPDNAVVTGVTLLLKRSSFLGVNPFTTHGDLQVDIASPFFSPEIFLRPGDFEAAASAANVGIFNPVAQPGNWYEAALDLAAFAHVNLFGSTQLRAHFSLDDNDDLGADLIRFFSGNHFMPSYRPTLIVEYYIP
ncbi:MAG: hypothetical protein HFACDABA_02081 [Anaerolineales bacterium]|nr:hypothetical protein [Anaerolineales bacterium]